MRLCLVHSTDLLGQAQHFQYHVTHGTDNPSNLLKCSFFFLICKEELYMGIKAPFYCICYFFLHNAVYIAKKAHLKISLNSLFNIIYLF